MSLLMRSGSAVGECCLCLSEGTSIAVMQFSLQPCEVKDHEFCGLCLCSVICVSMVLIFISDQADEEGYSPLHLASSEGHTAIIVALVEEGGADVNLQGGERKDTPLMLSVSHSSGIAKFYVQSLPLPLPPPMLLPL